MDFVDAREVDHDAAWKAEVCVVGAGAAGITLARKLAESGADVLLVESGSHAREQETQDLYRGENVGLPYPPLDHCRLRLLGGTTNHWAGFCHPILPRDFEPVPGHDLTRWPIDYAEMEPYFRRSEQALGFAPGDFDPSSGIPPAELARLRRYEDIAEIRMLVQVDDSRRRFAEYYGDELRSSARINVLLNANVVDIDVDSNGRRVRSLSLKTLNGRSLSVQARFFVLACHGIENARLLLASNGVVKSGIGNDGDWVGRGFTEHAVLYRSAFFSPFNESVFSRLFSRNDGDNIIVALTVPWPVQRSSGTMQSMSIFKRISRSEQLKYALKRLLRRGADKFSPALLDDIVGFLRHLQDSVDEEMRGRVFYRVEQSIAQVPNFNSRVFLSEDRDELGSLRANLDWQLTDDDVRTFNVGRDAVVRFVGAAGLGRIFAPEITVEKIEHDITGYCHHMGTTRMSEAPRDGVVDHNCKVHGIDNLFVAGSSIFCRPMFESPTMAIVAFSMRLADHIRRQSRT